jgi:hypothetical protein
MQWAQGAARKWAFAIDGAAYAVNDSADKGVADIDARRTACSGDFASSVNLLHFAQWHEKNAVVAEADHFGLKAAEAGRANFADVAKGNIRPDGFDNESRDLHDFAHPHQRGGGFDATAQVLHERGQNGRALVHFSDRATF